MCFSIEKKLSLNIGKNLIMSLYVINFVKNQFSFDVSSEEFTYIPGSQHCLRSSQTFWGIRHPPPPPHSIREYFLLHIIWILYKPIIYHISYILRTTHHPPSFQNFHFIKLKKIISGLFLVLSANSYKTFIFVLVDGGGWKILLSWGMFIEMVESLCHQIGSRYESSGARQSEWLVCTLEPTLYWADFLILYAR